jgi:hypothetical protein
MVMTVRSYWLSAPKVFPRYRIGSIPLRLFSKKTSPGTASCCNGARLVVG